MQASGKDNGPENTAQGTPLERNEMNQIVEPELDVRLDARAQALIGRRLKTVYEELVQQPVPDHLLKLLEELERREQKG